MPPPLSGLHVVATMPPRGWFGGIDYNFAVEMACELRDLGATVFELDTGGFITSNDLYIEGAIEALRSFRPDVAVSLPNAGYALLCKTRGQNVFRDILSVPTIMLWDHGLLQFPKLILDPLPRNVDQATDGAIRRLREALNHPLYFHYSPDRGHIAAMAKLGVVDSGSVRHFLQPAYPNFVHHGYRVPSSNAFRTRLAFAGNVYLQASQSLPFRGQAVLEGIEARVLAAKKNRLTECLWDLVMAELDALGPKTVMRFGLYPDSTAFWGFVHDEIELAGNTDVRLAVLTGIKRAFDFYGNFVEPGAVRTLRDRYHIAFQRSLDYFTELPLLFANTEVVIDVINLGYNSGISPKVMGCMACGGLVLFDYKDDFYQAVGEVANQVMFRSVDHLNSLIEDYLGDPRKRRDVSRHLQHRVCTEFSFGTLCRKILSDEPVWRD